MDPISFRLEGDQAGEIKTVPLSEAIRLATEKAGFDTLSGRWRPATGKKRPRKNGSEKQREMVCRLHDQGVHPNVIRLRVRIPLVAVVEILKQYRPES